MNIKLTMLIEKLKHYNLTLYLSHVENIFITSVKFLFENQQIFEPHVLYIGKTSIVPKIYNNNCYINLLCVKDTSIPINYKKNPMINLIIIDSTNDLFSIFNEIQDILSDFNQYFSMLIDALINNKGLQKIIDISYSLIENPIILFDTSFKIISYPKNIQFEDSLWKEALLKGYFPSKYVSKIKSSRCVEKVYKSHFPVLENLSTEKYKKIITNIIIDNKIVAHLKIFEYKNPFKKSDFEILAFLSKIISAEMQKTNFFENTKGLMCEYFIIDLLEGNIRDNKIIEERIHYLDLNFKENLYVLTIKSRCFNTENIPLVQAKDYLENIIISNKSIIYNNNIVIIINCKNRALPFGKNFKKLEEFLYNNKLCGGFSKCFTKLIDLQKHFKQSLKAIELGIRIDPLKTFFVYDNYVIYHMMDAYSIDELKSFCHSSLIKLIEFDKKNNTNYVKTLNTYVLENENKVSSANSLHIHRNTINYRISKIEEIMNVDLNNKDLIFNLNLSFKILKFIGKDQQNG